MPSKISSSGLAHLLQEAINLVLPPRCAATGEIVDRPGMLSPSFWKDLSFIDDPMCVTCGMPFSIEAPKGTLCAACLSDPPIFDQARSTVIYNDPSRQLILGFKYGDRLQTVHTFIPWLLRAGSEMIDTCDVIIPVPLHKKRLWDRRFNQSAVIASALAAASKKNISTDALVRLRATIQQKGLSRAERKKNVEGAFAVPAIRRERLKKKNVLLIDDVYTSGATINECCRILKKSGADKVFVLTVARVTREDFQ